MAAPGENTFWLCPVLPEHRTQRQLPQAQAAVNGTMPVPQLSWDMGDAVTRPLSHVHHVTRSNQLGYCILYRGDAVHSTWRQCAHGEQGKLPKHPTLVSMTGSEQPGGHVLGRGARFGLAAASSPQVPSWAVLGSLLCPLSPCMPAHLHDVLNDRGPSGELVGLLADPLLPLRLAPAAQGGLGRRQMGTP